MPAPSQTVGADGAGFLGGDTVKTVYDQLALEAFRAANVHRRLADWKRDLTDEPMPGNVITFTKIAALAAATTPLAEATEPTPVKVGDTQGTVTLIEQGNAVKDTKLLRVTSFLNIDMVIPAEVARNMEESMDLIAREKLVAGTSVLYAGAATSRVTVAAASTLAAANIRRAAATLKGNNTPPPDGSTMYVAIIHPYVALDLQAEAGQQAWSAPHVYSDPSDIYTGELGAFAGVRFVENSNGRNFVDAGVTSTVDVYATLVCGKQALAEGIGEAQHMVLSGPFDDLQRFKSIGWYALEGFSILRQESVVRIESSSSIGTNV